MIDRFAKWNPIQTELVILVNGLAVAELYSSLLKLVAYSSQPDSNIKILKNFSTNLIDSLNLSLKYIDGEYLTLIGNDDFFLKEIEHYTLFAKKKSIQGIKYKLDKVYYWPGTRNNKSKLIIQKDFGKSNYLFNPKRSIAKVINSVGQDYLDYPLINFYHGVVERKLIEKNLYNLGRYVGGFSPDIYFAITLSYNADNVLFINFPLTLPGVGLGSYSNDSIQNSHNNKSYSSVLKNHADYNRWPLGLPVYYSTETIWASSFLIALDDLNIFNSKKFDYKLLYVLMYLKISDFRKNESIMTFLKSISFERISRLIFRFCYKKSNKIINVLTKRIVYTDVSLKDLEVILEIEGKKNLKSFENKTKDINFIK